MASGNPTIHECVSQNMADALQLNQSFSVVDPFFGRKLSKTTKQSTKNSLAHGQSRESRSAIDTTRAETTRKPKRGTRRRSASTEAAADAWVAKATTYANMKQYEKAIKHLEEAMRLDPEVRNAKEYLENVRAAQAAAAQKEAAAQASAQNAVAKSSRNDKKRKDTSSASGSRRSKRLKEAPSSSDSEGEDDLKGDDGDWPLPRSEIVAGLKSILAGVDPDKMTFRG